MAETDLKTLDDLQREIEAAEETAKTWGATLSPRQIAWTPAPESWSIAQVFDHLNIFGDAYGKAIHRCIKEARDRGWTGDGTSRPGRFERWFLANTEPPPKRRFKAPKKMQPPGNPEALGNFVALQQRLLQAVEEARGLDLNRPRLRNPFIGLWKMRLGAALEILSAHQRRHLLQAEKVRQAENFPKA